MSKTLLLITLAFSLLGCALLPKAQSNPKPNLANAIEVTPERLVQVYTNNPVDGKARFEGATVKITGKILNIDDEPDHIVILFDSNFRSQKDMFVIAEFSKIESAAIAKLSKYDTATFYCIASRVVGDQMIKLTNCHP